MTNSPPERPAPTFPELLGLGLVMLAKVASDVAEITATMKRLEDAATKPTRKAAAASIEALGRRIIEQLSNPYIEGSDRSWVTWGRLQRDFPELTEYRRKKLSEYWR